MPRTRLTQNFIDELKGPNKTTVYWDESLAGFGVKITALGTKTYIVQRRIHHREHKLSIGRCEILKLQAAKDQARALFGKIAMGENPFAQSVCSVGDFDEFFELYISKYALREKKPRSVLEDRRLIKNHLLPRLRRLNPETITRDDVITLKESIGTGRIELGHQRGKNVSNKLKGGKPTANRCLALLSKAFNFAMDEKYLSRRDNPVVRISRYKEYRKEEFLSVKELQALRKEISKARKYGLENSAALDAIKVLMYTGARLSEIRELQWGEVDFEKNVLNKPDTKTGARKIFFCPRVTRILSRRAHGSKSETTYVFPALRGNGAISLRKPWERLRDSASLSKRYTIHTLRHTFASHAIINGVSAHQLQILLGHSSVETTGIYITIADATSSADAQRISDIIASRRR